MSFTAFGPVYTAAMWLLPAKMDTSAAYAMIYAIWMQESRMQHRAQIGGPARSFGQFELGGIKGVLQHAASQNSIRNVLMALGYDDAPETSYRAIEHNDILALCYARLLLWTLPSALPGVSEPDKGWECYTDAWRPGKPHRETWDAFFAAGWESAGKR